MKSCTLCGVEKGLSFFSVRKASRDGYTSRCKLCISEAKKASPATANYNKEYRLKNLNSSIQRVQNWRAQNKLRVAAYHKQYITDRPAQRAMYDANKRAKRLLRYPKWLSEDDKISIAAFYNCARNLTEKTGIEHAVDHTIPLLGKTVSGFHVPSNLQILTAHDNNKKNNRYEIS